MADWKINYYNEAVFEKIETLPKKLLGKYGAITNRMIEHGPILGMPYVKAMKKGLYEIRLKSEEGIARVFFCIAVNSTIIILHSFIKKTQETPKKELDLAIYRMKEVKNHEL